MAEETQSSEDVAAEKLISFIEKTERLEDEKKEVADQIKEVKAEAKAEGFDMKAFNALLKLRKKSDVEREEEETILDAYKRAIGI
jgi:uncharacterized protein (UPF0335 family)